MSYDKSELIGGCIGAVVVVLVSIGIQAAAVWVIVLVLRAMGVL